MGGIVYNSDPEYRRGAQRRWRPRTPVGYNPVRSMLGLAKPLDTESRVTPPLAVERESTTPLQECF